MESGLADFIDIMREEIGIYRDLIEHARKKTALLVQGRIEDILESNKAEETFNIKLRILESEVARLVTGLCQVFKIPREEFTILKLADSVDEAAATEIRAQTNLFRNLADQLKAVNQRNMKLAESSVHYSRGLLDFIAGATGRYQGTGLLRPFPAASTALSHKA